MAVTSRILSYKQLKIFPTTICDAVCFVCFVLVFKECLPDTNSFPDSLLVPTLKFQGTRTGKIMEKGGCSGLSELWALRKANFVRGSKLTVQVKTISLQRVKEDPRITWVRSAERKL